MATDTTDTKLKRKKGRKPTKSESPSHSSYLGPSLDQILQMTDEQILAGFAELGIEPSRFKWHEDDNQLNVAHWHDHGLTMSSEEFVKTAPKDKAGLAKLKADSLAIHRKCLRMELLSANLHSYIESLSDAQLIEEVERLSSESLSESEKRYAKVADLRQRVSELTWPELVKASKLYVPVRNPLTGRED